MASPGLAAMGPNYGQEDKQTWGTLTTTEECDPITQTFDDTSKLYVGKYPSLPGWYRGYYENIVDAVRGDARVEVDPAMARDGIRIMELARESHEKRATVMWS
jgi:predicted dehydrogenase